MKYKKTQVVYKYIIYICRKCKYICICLIWATAFSYSYSMQCEKSIACNDVISCNNSSLVNIKIHIHMYVYLCAKINFLSLFIIVVYKFSFDILTNCRLYVNICCLKGFYYICCSLQVRRVICRCALYSIL